MQKSPQNKNKQNGQKWVEIHHKDLSENMSKKKKEKKKTKQKQKPKKQTNTPKPRTFYLHLGMLWCIPLVQWFILSNQHKNHMKEQMLLDEDPVKREAWSAESSALIYTTST